MLRITAQDSEVRSVTLKVEGRIVADWGTVLEGECRQHIEAGRRVALDLSDVSYVDTRGVGLLRNLADASVEIVNCSSLITQLVQGG